MAIPEGICQALEADSKTLNELSDRLNQQAAEYQEYIKSLNIGIHVKIEIGNSISVGYGKIADKWCLYLESRSDIWPFSMAPRDYRIASIPYLKNLLTELHNEVIKKNRQLILATEEMNKK